MEKLKETMAHLGSILSALLKLVLLCGSVYLYNVHHIDRGIIDHLQADRKTQDSTILVLMDKIIQNRK